MKVRDLMKAPVHTTEPGNTAESAYSRMKAEGIRHLVVLSEGEVVGVLSERDIGAERGRAMRLGQTVGEMMGGDPVVVHPDLDVRDAAALLGGCQIGCLPVIEDGALVGIVTRADMVNLLGNLRV